MLIDGRPAVGNGLIVPGAGVDALLPFVVTPILYDCEMPVRAKNDVAAANILAQLNQCCE